MLVSLDQLGNTLAGGHPDETISSRIGKWKESRQDAGAWPPSRWHPLRWLDAALERIDPGHAIDAIERDEGQH